MSCCRPPGAASKALLALVGPIFKFADQQAGRLQSVISVVPGNTQKTTDGQGIPSLHKSAERRESVQPPGSSTDS